ncbi:MAG: hypothetical protein HY073_01855 [Deltaproteobacteria bacterium]|nr:hypothetical protein [Deltaproteobacteria bacterium]
MKTRWFLVIGLIFLAVSPVFAYPQAALRTADMTNGTVNAMVQDSYGNTYIGGNFTAVGPYTGSFAPLDTTTGKLSGNFPKVNGTVYAIIPDGNNGWYIGGQFTSIGNYDRVNIAHISESGEVDGDFRVRDASNNPFNASIMALSLNGGKLYVGGMFTNFSDGNNNHSYFVAIDTTTGGVATGWTAFSASPVTSVKAIAIDGNTVYVGGGFQTSYTPAGGSVTTLYNLIALQADTGRVVNAQPGPLVSTSMVNALVVVTDSAGVKKLLVGGNQINGANPLAAFLITNNASNGTRDTGFAPNSLSGPIFAILPVGNNLYTATATNGVLKLNALDGSAVAGWTAIVPNGSVNSIATDNNSMVYIAGVFTLANQAAPLTSTRAGLAALNADGTLSSSWMPVLFTQTSGTQNSVFTIASSGSNLHIGGSFVSAGGQWHKSLAKLDSRGNLISPAWMADVKNAAGNPATVYSLVVNESEQTPALYVGGSFVSLANQTRNNVGAVSLANGTTLPWAPATDNDVRAIASDGNAIYIGGNFGNIVDLTGVRNERNQLAAFAEITPAGGGVPAPSSTPSSFWSNSTFGGTGIWVISVLHDAQNNTSTIYAGFGCIRLKRGPSSQLARRFTCLERKSYSRHIESKQPVAHRVCWNNEREWQFATHGHQRHHGLT